VIPKVLHYCWFGSSELPQSVQHARSTWEKFMPDYEIIEWNASNYSLDESDYVRSCVENKRWAFLSDYLKADILAKHGGIFLDADVVAHRDLGSFLSRRAFSGFECRQLPFTAVWGAEAGHPWPVAAREYMDNLDVETIGDEANTYWMSRILEERFGIDPLIDTYQEGNDDIVIYPSETLCLGTHVGWTSHLFAGSWMPEGERGRYGVALNDRREAAARLEMSAPVLAMGAARVVAFGLPESAEFVISSRGKWVSEEVPEVVGLVRATQSMIDVGRYLGSLYVHGLRKAARRRFGKR
jgi:hypothetical protein